MSEHGNERARAEPTAVSYVIFRRGDSVLLQLRRGTGYMDGWWATAAAGHVEEGESAGDAALREAREEVGVGISPDELSPLTVLHRTQLDGDGVAARIDYFFACSSWDGGPRIMEPGKASDLQWFRLDGLPVRLIPHERYVLERLEVGLPATVRYGGQNAEGYR